MGPRFFNRGKGERNCHICGQYIGFNGAAIFQSRKGLWYPSGTGSVDGFNGAAIFQSRKGCVVSWMSVLSDPLQWGRDFSIAERPSARDDAPNTDWLQWGRDFSIAERWNGQPLAIGDAGFNGAAIFQSRKGCA